jgi:hypothetical protein
LDLPKLLDDPNQLGPNLNAYINGFSKNVREIMERFAFDQQIARMAENNILYEVVKKFAAVPHAAARRSIGVLGSTEERTLSGMTIFAAKLPFRDLG